MYFRLRNIIFWIILPTESHPMFTHDAIIQGCLGESKEDLEVDCQAPQQVHFEHASDENEWEPGSGIAYFSLLPHAARACRSCFWFADALRISLTEGSGEYSNVLRGVALSLFRCYAIRCGTDV
ncbi:hypothetical protein DEU56DRAFT_764044 [Suillus clintonianus]|uniref:uncharacterized protein n=1 Tax=Suillus clintonianus TaxID=1904413 RepID=UPI001B8842D9|nr:uncharacterized protein DEU56DRAFT_764044 [Suillus clintonianus]KAG2157335.1 hypothetical protein DEU56DRAFT_764044 [Suillus clintonianus]